MKIFGLPALGAAALAFAATAAHAASIDVSPVISEAVGDVVVPVLVAIVPVIGGIVVMPLRRFLDQKSGDILAGRVDELLNKAIAYAAQQGTAWVGEHDFHVEVDNWLVKIAGDYATAHAPDLLKKAGALAADKASDFVKGEAAALLGQKITARLPAHPGVATLKASAPAPAATPQQAAA